MPFKRPKKRPSLTAFFAPGGGGAIPKPSLATLGKRPSSSSSASAPSPSPKLGSARRVSSPQQAFDRSAHITAASSSLSSSRVEPAPRSAPAFAKNSVSAPSPPLADLLDDDPFAKLDSPLPPGFAPGSAASSSGLSLDDRDAGLDHDHDLDGASRKQHVVLTSCPTSARATVSVTPPSRIAASTPSLSTTPSSSSSLSSSSPSSSPLSSSSTATSPLAASSTASTSTSHSSPALSPVQPNRPIRPRLHRRPRTSNGLGVADLPHTQTLPASARPAVQKRPSLPSLKTLAEMQLTVVPRMPKGHVGAKLPLEPWARNVHRGDEVRIRSPTDSTFDGVYAYSGFDSAQLHAHLDKDQDKDQRPPPPERDLAMGPYRAWDMNSATSSFASSVSVSDYEIESIVEEEEEEGGETEHDNDDDNEGAYDGMSDRDEPASAPSSTPAPDAPLAPSLPRPFPPKRTRLPIPSLHRIPFGLLQSIPNMTNSPTVFIPRPTRPMLM
ncbi:hypothetical protein PUNSTDRAFT_110970 [Punctularia strigosozonata HHB-11173 SS5]|uniref:uncharacterized protein n=1 Tax=Punctularia strigosozonata (strain HHB-11173) TaxID=741275 RepID=UPI00044170AD|nr:uncharacterized protein PUNSTDRAFT_110970 [Punctularia strigosozonata HHB-11173 SS5]EIN12514.1 hypothetical protein PUNSTDRAFT_110970 [Punctularia strigosozonata HHB-11173 SS5]